MSEDFKLAPERWCLRTGIRVMDPDGWDRRNYEESWRKPITRGEFLVRARSSTCMAWPTPLYDEKWKDEERKPAEHPNYDYCNCQDSWEHNQVLRALGEQKQTKDVELMSNTPDPVTPPAAPQDPISELLHSALAMHEMFLTLVQGGFTEYQALVMIAQMIKPNPST